MRRIFSDNNFEIVYIIKNKYMGENIIVLISMDEIVFEMRNGYCRSIIWEVGVLSRYFLEFFYLVISVFI